MERGKGWAKLAAVELYSFYVICGHSCNLLKGRRIDIHKRKKKRGGGICTYAHTNIKKREVTFPNVIKEHRTIWKAKERGIKRDSIYTCSSAYLFRYLLNVCRTRGVVSECGLIWSSHDSITEQKGFLLDVIVQFQYSAVKNHNKMCLTMEKH